MPYPTLSRLGVESRKKAGWWLANEDRLHYIYHDFKLALRNWRKAHHPDRGGDHDDYAEFNAACGLLLRSFHRRGIGGTPDPLRQRKDKRAYNKIYYEAHRGWFLEYQRAYRARLKCARANRLKDMG